MLIIQELNKRQRNGKPLDPDGPENINYSGAILIWKLWKLGQKKIASSIKQI